MVETRIYEHSSPGEVELMEPVQVTTHKFFSFQPRLGESLAIYEQKNALSSHTWDESANASVVPPKFKPARGWLLLVLRDGKGTAPSPGPLLALSSPRPFPGTLSTNEVPLCRVEFRVLMRRRHGGIYAIPNWEKSQEKGENFILQRARGWDSYPRASPDRPGTDRE